MAVLWCEARCEGIFLGYRGCQETAVGAFGVSNAKSTAKDSGWKERSDGWWCPSCIEKKAKPLNPSP